MKNILVLICSLFLCSIVSGQESITECGTVNGYTTKDTSSVPWYGNNEILNEYLEKQKDLFKGTVRPESRGSDKCANKIRQQFSIPIRFWVVLGSNETLQSVMSQLDLEKLIKDINQAFSYNGFNINFYTYCPKNFVSDKLVDIDNSAGTNTLTKGGDYDEFAINVYIVRSATGWTGLYNPFPDNITILRKSGSSTLIHELGHYFGLDHTHVHTEDPACCKREPVTRGKASPLYLV